MAEAAASRAARTHRTTLLSFCNADRRRKKPWHMVGAWPMRWILANLVVLSSNFRLLHLLFRQQRAAQAVQHKCPRKTADGKDLLKHLLQRRNNRNQSQFQQYLIGCLTLRHCVTITTAHFSLTPKPCNASPSVLGPTCTCGVRTGLQLELTFQTR